MEAALTTQDSSWKEEPGIGHILAISVGIGVALSLLVVTLAVHAVGQEWGSSIGLGLFVATWGGLGFGGMVGGVVHLSRLEAKEGHGGHGGGDPGGAVGGA